MGRLRQESNNFHFGIDRFRRESINSDFRTYHFLIMRHILKPTDFKYCYSQRSRLPKPPKQPY